GQRRQGGRTGRVSLWSAGKTGTTPGTEQRSRNPPDTAAFNGAVGGNRRPSGQRGCQRDAMTRSARMYTFSSPQENVSVYAPEMPEPPSRNGVSPERRAVARRRSEERRVGDEWRGRGAREH